MKKLNALHLSLGLLALSVATGAYLYGSNRALLASLTEVQEENKDQIAALEEKINTFETNENTESVDLSDFIQIQNETNEDSEEGRQLMNEADVLENYFSETPILIQPEENEEGNVTQNSGTGTLLTATPEVFDFGIIQKADGVVTADFQLKNESSANIILHYAFTSCGCTTAPLEESVVLQPGQSYPLHVSYDPNYYPTGMGLGEIEKTITIFANTGLFKVKLKANVVE